MAIIADPARRRSRAALAVLGALSALVYGYAALALPTSNRPRHLGLFLAAFALLFALYFLSARVVRRAPAGSGLAALLFGFAALFRLLAVGAGLPGPAPLAALADDLAGRRVAYEPFLLYDNDLWRYLWDGHVLASGLDPYALRPADVPAFDELERRLLGGARAENWRDVFDAVSFQRYATIYPPLVHYFFAALALLTPASAGAAKLALASVDLLVCLALWRILAAAGRRRELVVLWAWNPAVVKELSASAHPEALMVLPLILAPWLLWRGRPLVAGAALAAAVLAKLAALAVVPLLVLWAWRRRPRRLAPAFLAAFFGVAAAGWAPLAEGFGDWLAAFRRFAAEWTFNSGPWALARWLAAAGGAAEPATLAHAVTGGLFGALAVAIAWRCGRRRQADEPATLTGLYSGLFATLAALVLLSPAVMPWYVLWALPAAVVAGSRAWPLFTGLALLSYLQYADGAGTLWWKWLEYGGLALALLWGATKGAGANGPPAVAPAVGPQPSAGSSR